MKKLLLATFVALLMAGGGDDGKSTLHQTAAEAKAPFVEKWAEWEANPEPYGGLEVLAEIREAKESNATELDLGKFGKSNKITDLAPLAGLTKLEALILSYNKITDFSPLAGLTKLETLTLAYNIITDLSPLARLTKLVNLGLANNQITDLSPLAGLTKLEGRLDLRNNPVPDDQKEMLKKALRTVRSFSSRTKRTRSKPPAKARA